MDAKLQEEYAYNLVETFITSCKLQSKHRVVIMFNFEMSIMFIPDLMIGSWLQLNIAKKSPCSQSIPSK